MSLAQIVGDAPPVRCPFGEDIVTGVDVIHSYLSVLNWDEHARNAVGLYTITPHTPAPEGQRVEAVVLDLADGQVVEVATYGDLPPARRLIDKDLVSARLDAAGLFDSAMAILVRRPVLWGRWTNQNWPNVYADDPELLAVLTAIGADIETITAA